jgi:hypothetical protein
VQSFLAQASECSDADTSLDILFEVDNTKYGHDENGYYEVQAQHPDDE